MNGIIEIGDLASMSLIDIGFIMTGSDFFRAMKINISLNYLCCSSLLSSFKKYCVF